jgi:cell division protease FtsH
MLRGRIVGVLGGRAAKELVYDDVTTGAESDLEQVADRAPDGRALGYVRGDRPDERASRPRPRAGAGLPGASDGLSEATRQLIEAEARRIVEECYVRAIEELSENRDRLDRLAAALLEHETLDEPDVYRLAGLERDGRPKPEPEVAAAGLASVGPSAVAEAVSGVEA